MFAVMKRAATAAIIKAAAVMKVAAVRKAATHEHICNCYIFFIPISKVFFN